MEYSTLNGKKCTFVIREYPRKNYEQPNFMGTGKALVGILGKEQSLNDFIYQRRNKQKEAGKRADRAIREFNSNKIRQERAKNR